MSAAEATAVAEPHERLVAYRAPGGDDHDDAAVVQDPAWHALALAAGRAVFVLPS